MNRRYFSEPASTRNLPSFPTRRSSDLVDECQATLIEAEALEAITAERGIAVEAGQHRRNLVTRKRRPARSRSDRSEEHTSELQSHVNIVCRLLLEKKKR